MRRAKQSDRALEVLAGYRHGPDAALAAIRDGRTQAEAARAIILVEGISDQIAIETLARGHGRDLAAEGVLVFPTGGSCSLRRYLAEFAAAEPRPILAGLFDRDALPLLNRALAAAGLDAPESVTGLAALGFHISTRDLEDELIRAIGPARLAALIEAEGEGGALATLGKQAEWRDRSAGDLLHRFLRSKASRSLRYARLIVEALDEDRIPAPLSAVLASV